MCPHDRQHYTSESRALHAAFRRESEMRVVICHPGLPRDQEQTLRPWSTGIQNAASDCVVVFCHASLISSCGIKATVLSSSALSPDCLHFTKIKSIQIMGGNIKKWPYTLISFIRSRLSNEAHRGAIQ